MSKLSYSEQLRHPNWQRKRLEVMNGAGFQCENCGDEATTLNVHHKRYVKGRMAWEYDSRELACLCEPCHQSEHQARERLDRLLADGNGRTSIAAALLAGYLYADHDIDSEEANEAIGADGYAFMAGAVGASVYRVLVANIAPQQMAARLLTDAIEGLLRNWHNDAAISDFEARVHGERSVSFDELCATSNAGALPEERAF